MCMDKNEHPIINKIEVDEKTLEPIIVEVKPEEEIKEQPLYSSTAQNQQTVSETAVENSSKLVPHHDYTRAIEDDKLSSREFTKKAGKQLFLNNFFGVAPELSETDKRQKLFKKIFTIVFAVLMFGVIAYTFYTDFFAPGEEREVASLADFLTNFKANWHYLLLAFTALACCFLFKGFKLSIMCKSLTGKWHFKTCLETGIIGHYYNNVTPLAAGGQPFEIYHLSKHGVHGGTASSMPIVAFFMYQLAFVTFGIFCAICFSPATNIFDLDNVIVGSTTATVLRPMAIVGLCLGLFFPGLIVVFSLLPRPCSKLVGFVINLGGKIKLVKEPKKLVRKTLRTVVHNSRCIKKFATSPLVFISSYLVSLLEVISLCSIAFFTLKFFGYQSTESAQPIMLQWAQIVLVCMILYAAISFIPTPGNSGAADFSFYWLFSLGLMGGFAFPAMIVWRFLSYYMFIVVGIIFITGNKRREAKKALNDIDDEQN